MVSVLPNEPANCFYRKETIVTGCQETNGATRENTILVDKASRKFALEHFHSTSAGAKKKFGRELKLRKDKCHFIFPIWSVRRGVEFLSRCTEDPWISSVSRSIDLVSIGQDRYFPHEKILLQNVKYRSRENRRFWGYTESLKSIYGGTV